MGPPLTVAKCPYREETSMKELIRQYLDDGMSRRQLMTGLSALGMSTVAANAMAQSLSPASAAPPGATRDVQGTGGALFVAQLKAAGVKYVFFNPSTGDYPIFDALVDEPSIQAIKGIHEGAVVAMADGYARATGKPGVVIVANVGLPNAMTQMINSWKDQIPLLVAVASADQETMGRDQLQEVEFHETMTHPITKWTWMAKTTTGIPETLRRGFKFASTPPCGPVFLALPNNTLRDEAKAAIWDQAKFDVPMRIRPDKDDVEKAARLLIEAKNPLMSVGDEITWCHGEKEAVELAELLGLPVATQGGASALGFWSKPFPTRHPLYIGGQLREMRFPGKLDVLINLGNRFGDRAAPGTTLISIRHDPTSLARATPVDLAMVADIRLATADLIAAIKSFATPTRLKEIAAERTARTRAYSSEMAEFRMKIARENADRSPITLSRIGLELEGALAPDTCYVCDVDSGKAMDPLMSFGGADKTYFSTGPNILGWGMAAAFGVKVARPDQPVVSVVGDGSFCFSGPQPLWSQARYRVPVMNIVLNNRSYNNERNRIWAFGGRQFKTGRDMTCYIGSPDVDYVKAAGAFGVEGEVVTAPGEVKAAILRAQRVIADGRPYLLDIHTQRDGIGAASTWHPVYSVADLRTRRV
ncbi:MAG TPA: thiamine pyrophosphate-binding protein [Stellaceae bacterium]|nr:thiamine pyrophosphate-binding protein [Stellaceae bacterium]